VQYVDIGKDFDAGMQSLIDAMTEGRELREEDPVTEQQIRLSGKFPYSQLDMPIRGRDADIQTAKNLLQGQRLLVLMAIGGTGKTRLAAQLAFDAEAFKDGVIWQTLDNTSKVDSLTYLIRDHLRLESTTEADATWDALGKRGVLIILDNAESVVDRAGFAKYLENYPMDGGTRVLMTTREQWNETKRFNRTYDLTAPDLEAAEKIVRDMAEKQGFADILSGHEREFAEAARRHPRLIEFAIGWLHDFTLPRVLTMLSELTGSDVQEVLEDVLHKTLRQIESTPEGLQAIADLKKLLVFKGGFTDPAAEAILGDVESLRILRRWNLLHLDSGRYSPDPLVEAALEADSSAHPAHYDFYYALARKHNEAQDYLGLDPESDNLTAAFEWTMGAGEFEKAYWFRNACSTFLANRGRYDQRKAWLEQVAEALHGHPDEGLGANVQNSLGVLYQNMPTGDRRENLRRAIAAFEAALVYWTPQTAPLDYAMTQNNLGITYSVLAALEAREANLRHAIAAFEAALDYYTPQATPLHYATTQNNLGAAYWDLAQIENREANLRRAIAAFEAALVYWTPQTAPLDYAMTQNNLGNTYSKLAQIENREANLRHAIAAYEAALVYYTPQAAPLDYAMTQNNLGNTYSDLAKLEDREVNLRRAIAAYEAALLYRTPQAAPLDYAMTQRNLGNAYEDLGDMEKACTAWREAEKYYRLMGYIDKADDVAGWLEADCN
jgi:tetratricopeptide (TPR) repeat protein